MSNISGFGGRVYLRASVTFPIGFLYSEFADDGDPVDVENTQIADASKGVNGHAISWSTAEMINATLRPIPNSPSDDALKRLMLANMPSNGNNNALDEITLTLIYANGRSVTLAEGTLTSGSAVNSITQSGRLRTPEYAFKFGTVNRNF